MLSEYTQNVYTKIAVLVEKWALFSPAVNTSEKNGIFVGNYSSRDRVHPFFVHPIFKLFCKASAVSPYEKRTTTASKILESAPDFSLSTTRPTHARRSINKKRNVVVRGTAMLNEKYTELIGHSSRRSSASRRNVCRANRIDAGRKKSPSFEEKESITRVLFDLCRWLLNL